MKGKRALTAAESRSHAYCSDVTNGRPARGEEKERKCTSTRAESPHRTFSPDLFLRFEESSCFVGASSAALCRFTFRFLAVFLCWLSCGPRNSELVLNVPPWGTCLRMCGGEGVRASVCVCACVYECVNRVIMEHEDKHRFGFRVERFLGKLLVQEACTFGA